MMRLFLLLAALCTAAPALAYIGPGAGINLLGSLWAVLVGIVLALAAILFWPLRLLWRRMRSKRKATPAPPATSNDSSDA